MAQKIISKLAREDIAVLGGGGGDGMITCQLVVFCKLLRATSLMAEIW